ncbi:zinc finger protein 498 [Stylonychia lemnae]|uniref:Zinc finger protein 498 n=1 Tax=Stylonychia lemnae TaxID=5949 RepID=A0A078B8C7_STYLE|nr:zinc finger protein 498 [Stylonychia lemnae]|eukprot:CDW90446.1 zinc finger protein 498 [Stylonychia lemnae]
MIQEEVFICQFPDCDKKFTTKFSLKRHYYIHSKQKTFQCAYCDKSFALPQYLREHQYTHTNQEPFVCGVEGCTQSFRQRGKLSLHRRTHNNFQKKEYRLVNSLDEFDNKNSLLGVIQKLKRPFSEAEKEYIACELNKQTGTKISNSELIEFVSKNEEECAKYLCNYWAPLKRRRTNYNQSQDIVVTKPSDKQNERKSSDSDLLLKQIDTNFRNSDLDHCINNEFNLLTKDLGKNDHEEIEAVNINIQCQNMEKIQAINSQIQISNNSDVCGNNMESLSIITSTDCEDVHETLKNASFTREQIVQTNDNSAEQMQNFNQDKNEQQEVIKPKTLIVQHSQPSQTSLSSINILNHSQPVIIGSQSAIPSYQSLYQQSSQNPLQSLQHQYQGMFTNSGFIIDQRIPHNEFQSMSNCSNYSIFPGQMNGMINRLPKQ